MTLMAWLRKRSLMPFLPWRYTCPLWPSCLNPVWLCLFVSYTSCYFSFLYRCIKKHLILMWFIYLNTERVTEYKTDHAKLCLTPFYHKSILSGKYIILYPLEAYPWRTLLHIITYDIIMGGFPPSFGNIGGCYLISRIWNHLDFNSFDRLILLDILICPT